MPGEAAQEAQSCSTPSTFATNSSSKPHILLSRAGEPDTVRIYLNEVRYLADAMCSMAAEMAGRIVGDEDD